MKLLYKTVFSLLTLLIVIYYSSFYVLPSISIVNSSTVGIAQAEVDLPASHLDFGSIAGGSSNALHYSLTQPKDGVYSYTIKFTDSVEITGSCGYVTDNELNKRVVITVETDYQIRCERQ